MDGGANICVTGDLNQLVNIINIPPMLITVATSGDGNSLDDCCTKRGYIPLTLEDGTIYWQLCFYCANITETIISPHAVLVTSNVFASWCQTEHKDGRPGYIRFDSHDGILSMTLSLEYKDGLYNCPTDVYTVDDCPSPPQKLSAFRVAAPTPSTSRRSSQFIPTSKGKLVESESWLLCLGSPGIHQLDKLPGNVTRTPPDFDYHPFWFIDFKEAAQVQKEAAQRSAIRTTERKRRFYMDFGFIRSSTSDYSRPLTFTDRVVFSYDGYSSYLIVIDEASRYIWIFLTASKDPPITIVREFLTHHYLLFIT
jgi:hypothetical protein